jgi:hypothetical protein
MVKSRAGHRVTKKDGATCGSGVQMDVVPLLVSGVPGGEMILVLFGLCSAAQACNTTSDRQSASRVSINIRSCSVSSSF